MATISPRYTDINARVVLPPRFANSAVLVEEVSETELRIRKADPSSEDQIAFTEEQRPKLPDEDRDFLLNLLANPPAASPEVQRMARGHHRD